MWAVSDLKGSSVIVSTGDENYVDCFVYGQLTPASSPHSQVVRYI
jgi:hypothetical protein